MTRCPCQMFGTFGDQMPTWMGIAVIPIFAWELTLAIWLIAKGFKPSAIASSTSRRVGDQLPTTVAAAPA